MATIQLPVRVDEELIERIDKVRDLVPRTAWVVRALERQLKADENGREAS